MSECSCSSSELGGKSKSKPHDSQNNKYKTQAYGFDFSKPERLPPPFPICSYIGKGRDRKAKIEFWEGLLKKREARLRQMTLKKVELCNTIRQLRLQLPPSLARQANTMGGDIMNATGQLTAASGDDLPSMCRTCMCTTCPISVPYNYPQNLYNFSYTKGNKPQEDTTGLKKTPQEKIKPVEKEKEQLCVCVSCPNERNQPSLPEKIETNRPQTTKDTVKSHSCNCRKGDKPKKPAYTTDGDKLSPLPARPKTDVERYQKLSNVPEKLIDNTCICVSCPRKKAKRPPPPKIGADFLQSLTDGPITIICNCPKRRKSKNRDQEGTVQPISVDAEPFDVESSLYNPDYEKFLESQEVIHIGKPDQIRQGNQGAKSRRTQPLDKNIEMKQPVDKNIDMKQPVDKNIEMKQPEDKNIEMKQPVDTNIEMKQPVDKNIEMKQPEDKNIQMKQPVDKNIEMKQPVDTNIEMKQPVDTNIEMRQPVDKNIEMKEVPDKETTAGVEKLEENVPTSKHQQECNTDVKEYLDQQTTSSIEKIGDQGLPSLKSQQEHIADVKGVSDKQTIASMKSDKQSVPSPKKPDLVQPICDCHVCVEEVSKRISSWEEQMKRSSGKSRNGTSRKRTDSNSPSSFPGDRFQPICDCAICSEAAQKRIGEEEGITSFKMPGIVSAKYYDMLPSAPPVCDCTECAEEVQNRITKLGENTTYPAATKCGCSYKRPTSSRLPEKISPKLSDMDGDKKRHYSKSDASSPKSSGIANLQNLQNVNTKNGTRTQPDKILSSDITDLQQGDYKQGLIGAKTVTTAGSLNRSISPKTSDDNSVKPVLTVRATDNVPIDIDQAYPEVNMPIDTDQAYPNCKCKECAEEMRKWGVSAQRDDFEHLCSCEDCVEELRKNDELQMDYYTQEDPSDFASRIERAPGGPDGRCICEDCYKGDKTTNSSNVKKRSNKNTLKADRATRNKKGNAKQSGCTCEACEVGMDQSKDQTTSVKKSVKSKRIDATRPPKFETENMRPICNCKNDAGDKYKRTTELLEPCTCVTVAVCPCGFVAVDQKLPIKQLDKFLNNKPSNYKDSIEKIYTTITESEYNRKPPTLAYYCTSVPSESEIPVKESDNSTCMRIDTMSQENRRSSSSSKTPNKSKNKRSQISPSRSSAHVEKRDAVCLKIPDVFSSKSSEILPVKNSTGSIEILHKRIAEIEAHITQISGAVYGCLSIPSHPKIIKRSDIRNVSKPDITRILKPYIKNSKVLSTSTEFSNTIRKDKQNDFVLEVKQLRQDISTTGYTLKSTTAEKRPITKYIGLGKEISKIIINRYSCTSVPSEDRTVPLRRTETTNTKISKESSSDSLDVAQPICSCGAMIQSVHKTIGDMRERRNSIPTLANFNDSPSAERQNLFYRLGITRSTITELKERKINCSSSSLEAKREESAMTFTKIINKYSNVQSTCTCGVEAERMRNLPPLSKPEENYRSRLLISEDSVKSNREVCFKPPSTSSTRSSVEEPICTCRTITQNVQETINTCEEPQTLTSKIGTRGATLPVDDQGTYFFANACSRSSKVSERGQSLKHESSNDDTSLNAQVICTSRGDSERRRKPHKKHKRQMKFTSAAMGDSTSSKTKQSDIADTWTCSQEEAYDETAVTKIQTAYESATKKQTDSIHSSKGDKYSMISKAEENITLLPKASSQKRTMVTHSTMAKIKKQRSTSPKIPSSKYVQPEKESSKTTLQSPDADGYKNLICECTKCYENINDNEGDEISGQTTTLSELPETTEYEKLDREETSDCKPCAEEVQTIMFEKQHKGQCKTCSVKIEMMVKEMKELQKRIAKNKGHVSFRPTAECSCTPKPSGGDVSSKRNNENSTLIDETRKMYNTASINCKCSDEELQKRLAEYKQRIQLKSTAECNCKSIQSGGDMSFRRFDKNGTDDLGMYDFKAPNLACICSEEEIKKRGAENKGDILDNNHNISFVVYSVSTTTCKCSQDELNTKNRDRTSLKSDAECSCKSPLSASSIACSCNEEDFKKKSISLKSSTECSCKFASSASNITCSCTGEELEKQIFETNDRTSLKSNAECSCKFASSPSSVTYSFIGETLHKHIDENVGASSVSSITESVADNKEGTSLKSSAECSCKLLPSAFSPTCSCNGDLQKQIAENKEGMSVKSNAECSCKSPPLALSVSCSCKGELDHDTSDVSSYSKPDQQIIAKFDLNTYDASSICKCSQEALQNITDQSKKAYNENEEIPNIVAVCSCKSLSQVAEELPPKASAATSVEESNVSSYTKFLQAGDTTRGIGCTCSIEKFKKMTSAERLSKISAGKCSCKSEQTEDLSSYVTDSTPDRPSDLSSSKTFEITSAECKCSEEEVLRKIAEYKDRVSLSSRRSSKKDEDVQVGVVVPDVEERSVQAKDTVMSNYTSPGEPAKQIDDTVSITCSCKEDEKKILQDGDYVSKDSNILSSKAQEQEVTPKEPDATSGISKDGKGELQEGTDKGGEGEEFKDNATDAVKEDTTSKDQALDARAYKAITSNTTCSCSENEDVQKQVTPSELSDGRTDQVTDINVAKPASEGFITSSVTCSCSENKEVQEQVNKDRPLEGTPSEQSDGRTGQVIDTKVAIPASEGFITSSVTCSCSENLEVQEQVNKDSPLEGTPSERPDGRTDQVTDTKVAKPTLEGVIRSSTSCSCGESEEAQKRVNIDRPLEGTPLNVTEPTLEGLIRSSTSCSCGESEEVQKQVNIDRPLEGTLLKADKPVLEGLATPSISCSCGENEEERKPSKRSEGRTDQVSDTKAVKLITSSTSCSCDDISSSKKLDGKAEELKEDALSVPASESRKDEQKDDKFEPVQTQTGKPFKQGQVIGDQERSPVCICCTCGQTGNQPEIDGLKVILKLLGTLSTCRCKCCNEEYEKAKLNKQQICGCKGYAGKLQSDMEETEKRVAEEKESGSYKTATTCVCKCVQTQKQPVLPEKSSHIQCFCRQCRKESSNMKISDISKTVSSCIRAELDRRAMDGRPPYDIPQVTCNCKVVAPRTETTPTQADVIAPLVCTCKICGGKVEKAEAEEPKVTSQSYDKPNTEVQTDKKDFDEKNEATDEVQKISIAPPTETIPVQPDVKDKSQPCTTWCKSCNKKAKNVVADVKESIVTTQSYDKNSTEIQTDKKDLDEKNETTDPILPVPEAQKEFIAPQTKTIPIQADVTKQSVACSCCKLCSGKVSNVVVETEESKVTPQPYDKPNAEVQADKEDSDEKDEASESSLSAPEAHDAFVPPQTTTTPTQADVINQWKEMEEPKVTLQSYDKPETEVQPDKQDLDEKNKASDSSLSVSETQKGVLSKSQSKCPCGTAEATNGDIDCKCSICREKLVNALETSSDREDKKVLKFVDASPNCSCGICNEIVLGLRQNLPEGRVQNPPCSDCTLVWTPTIKEAKESETTLETTPETVKPTDNEDSASDNEKDNCDDIPTKETQDKKEQVEEGDVTASSEVSINLKLTQEAGDVPEHDSLPESTQESVYESIASECICSGDQIGYVCTCPIHTQSLFDDTCSHGTSCTCTITDTCMRDYSDSAPRKVAETESSCSCMGTSSTSSLSSSELDTNSCSCCVSDSFTSESESETRLPRRISSYSTCSCRRQENLHSRSEKLEQYVQGVVFDGNKQT